MVKKRKRKKKLTIVKICKVWVPSSGWAATWTMKSETEAELWNKNSSFWFNILYLRTSVLEFVPSLLPVQFRFFLLCKQNHVGHVQNGKGKRFNNLNLYIQTNQKAKVRSQVYITVSALTTVWNRNETKCNLVVFVRLKEASWIRTWEKFLWHLSNK